MDLGGRLFKFSRPSDHALQNLRNGKIFCQHYAAYNDPFEFWTNIIEGIPDPDREPERYLAALQTWGFHFRSVAEAKADPTIEALAVEYFDECQHYVPPFEAIRQRARISCFSSEADNLLMWSHYGDGLRGLCIAFDEGEFMEDGTDGSILDVAYLGNPPEVDSFIYGLAWDQDWFSDVAIEETNVAIEHQGKTERQPDIEMYQEAGAAARRTMLEILQQVFATKPAEWQYERERRLLIQASKDDASPILRTYRREAVRTVILGERMPDDYRALVETVVREHYPDAAVKTARRARGTYTITIE